MAQVDAFAVCPIVEGALVRLLLRTGEPTDTAQRVLAGVRAHPRCQFWPASISYVAVELTTVHSHRHLTDSYLVSLARAHGGLLATLDRPLADRHPEHTLLVPPRQA